MNMRALLATLALAGALPPAAATANAFFEDNSLTLSAGAAIVSEYVSQGFELSDGVALQPYAELGFGGFYAGIWAINGSEDLLGATGEVDLMAGYRGSYEAFFWDVSYAYYLFTGKTFAEEYGEIVLTGGVGFLESIFFTGYYGYADEFEQHDVSLIVDYYTPIEGASLSGRYGTVDTNFGDWDYWSVGAKYQATENISIGLA